NEPVAMVSGDFIFVGDVGRPDLLETAAKIQGTMVDSARQLFHSLQATLDLPDHLQIWPGHGAGSACGKALGAVPTSTLGYERRTNWAFGIDDEDQFVTTVLVGQPTPPTYFARMKQVNRDGPVILGRRSVLPQMNMDTVPGAIAEGVVIDVRPGAAYRLAHLPGTQSLPLIKAFTTWAGWLLDADRNVVVIAESELHAIEARTALASVGIDRVPGWIDATAIASHADVRSSSIGDVTAAEGMITDGRTVIDLREIGEWSGGHIPGALHHPLGRIEATLADMPRDTPVAVHCQGGTRSGIGASVLERMGFTDVVDLTGGYRGWKRAREGGPE
ncbi:MAG: rhodanese-like domain-containing protein, partial [Gemmatimonadota bacterium]